VIVRKSPIKYELPNFCVLTFFIFVPNSVPIFLKVELARARDIGCCALTHKSCYIIIRLSCIVIWINY